MAAKISTDLGCAKYLRLLFSLLMINLPPSTIENFLDNADCSEKGIEMWAKVRERSNTIRRIGHIDLGTSMWEPISPHAKGPLIQPPSPIWPLARIHTRKPQLPGKVQNIISCWKSRGQDFWLALVNIIVVQHLEPRRYHNVLDGYEVGSLYWYSKYLETVDTELALIEHLCRLTNNPPAMSITSVSSVYNRRRKTKIPLPRGKEDPPLSFSINISERTSQISMKKGKYFLQEHTSWPWKLPPHPGFRLPGDKGRRWGFQEFVHHPPRTPEKNPYLTQNLWRTHLQNWRKRWECQSPQNRLIITGSQKLFRMTPWSTWVRAHSLVQSMAFQMG